MTLTNHSVSNPRPSNRACGSPAHGSPTSFTAGIRRHPPGPEGSGWGNGPDQVDQPELVWRGEGHDPPPEGSAAAVTLGEEYRHPHPGVPADLVEVVGGVAIPEVRGPAA